MVVAPCCRDPPPHHPLLLRVCCVRDRNLRGRWHNHSVFVKGDDLGPQPSQTRGRGQQCSERGPARSFAAAPCTELTMAKPPVVCDNGTGFVKCGFAGDNFPAHIFPSIVGRPILRSEEKIQNVQLKVRARAEPRSAPPCVAEPLHTVVAGHHDRRRVHSSARHARDVIPDHQWHCAELGGYDASVRPGPVASGAGRGCL